MPTKKRALKETAVTARKKHKTTNDDAPANKILQVEDTSAHSQPCSDVFKITEILEGILEYLPPRTLFQAQRVSKHFQATISDSLHTQQRMLLRLDNRPVAPWIVPIPHGEEVNFVPKIRVGDDARRVVRPVIINPHLELANYWGAQTTAQRAGQTLGEILQFSNRRRITLAQLEHLSSRMGYICDPYCPKIRVTLCFHIGSTVITVSSRFTGRLSISAIIARALDRSSHIVVRDRGHGNMYSRSPSISRLGVVRPLIAQLKQQTGLEVYFSPVEFSFKLFDVVAPMDEERAAVESVQNRA